MADTTQWIVGWKRASTWGTPVACGASDAVLVSQESMPEAIPEPIADECVGQTLKGSPMQGNFKADGGSFVEPVRFTGFERRLALFAGLDTCAQIGTTGVYTHIMPLLPSIAGKFGTLAIDKKIGTDKIWEFPSVKLNTLELSHENGKLSANWGCIANKCVRNSAVNTSATMATVTHPGVNTLVIFNQLTMLLKEITGSEGNLSGSDELKPSAVKFNINRNLGGDFVCGSSAGESDEPGVTGLPDAQLVVTFPQHNSAIDAFILANQARLTGSVPKKYKISLKWLGPIAAGSTNYYFEALIAMAVISKAPANAGGAGSKVPVEITFDLFAPGATINGSDWAWTANNYPIQFTLANLNAVRADQ